VPTTLREVKISHKLGLNLYRSLDGGDGAFESVMQLGSRVGAELGTNRVWMLGLSEFGSSAAELIPSLCRLLSDAEVDCRWMVLESDEQRFYETAQVLAEMLQGLEVEGPSLEERRPIYDGVLEAVADSIQKYVDPRDVLMVHGSALAGLARFLPDSYHNRLVWCSYSGNAEENEPLTEAWEFLRPYLRPYARCLFAERRFIPPFLRDRAGVITPGIDPLSHKNRTLRPYKLAGVLRSAGLIERPNSPAWGAFETPVRVLRGNTWKKEPILSLLHRPLVVQVSRFERLKGFVELLDGFQHMLKTYPERVPHLKVEDARLTAELECVELVIAGADPDDLPYNSTGNAILKELAEHHSALPPEVAKRVHVLRLPMRNGKENALVINALQRLATVVVQNSLQHGFGLTVTEALWKGAPVVASGVGGIGHQIRSGIDGTLIDDPRDPESVASGILEALADPRAAEARARSGQKRVAENFLILQCLRTLLEEIDGLIQGAGALRPRPVAGRGDELADDGARRFEQAARHRLA
jgi:trehalose synthase